MLFLGYSFCRLLSSWCIIVHASSVRQEAGWTEASNRKEQTIKGDICTLNVFFEKLLCYLGL